MNETKVKIDKKAGVVFIPMASLMEGITFEGAEKMYKLVRIPLAVRRKKGLREGQVEK